MKASPGATANQRLRAISVYSGLNKARAWEAIGAFFGVLANGILLFRFFELTLPEQKQT